MSKGHTVILRTPAQRDWAKRLIDAAPDNAVVKVGPPTRTIAQNDLMWELLSKLSAKKPEARAYPPHVWKALVMDIAGHKPVWERSLDGQSVVCIGYKSSRLSKSEMSDVIEATYAYAAEHGIDLDAA